MKPTADAEAGGPAMHHARIVLIEDDADLAAMSRLYLERDGYRVVWAGDARSGHKELTGGLVDLAVLDLGLPDGSGLDLLRDMQGPDRLPVVIVTGRGEEADRVLGLELGADDYLVKPFSQRELSARIRAVLRRTRANAPSDAIAPSDVIALGALQIDTAACLAQIDRTPLPLRPKEYALLKVLAHSPGRVYSSDQLIELVWSTGPWQSAASVTEHIYRLRCKLTAALQGRPGPSITTVRGYGYRLDM
ncbi:response regulator transcription factor [Streptomyces sp. NPDC051561]|uniref:response regulator transcription factor n=1 Tax=Streptomyces sp. NPDC051561 TaxID=3365658 RepID=UPI0037A2FC62